VETAPKVADGQMLRSRMNGFESNIKVCIRGGRSPSLLNTTSEFTIRLDSVATDKMKLLTPTVIVFTFIIGKTFAGKPSKTPTKSTVSATPTHTPLCLKGEFTLCCAVVGTTGDRLIKDAINASSIVSTIVSDIGANVTLGIKCLPVTKREACSMNAVCCGAEILKVPHDVAIAAACSPVPN